MRVAPVISPLAGLTGLSIQEHLLTLAREIGLPRRRPTSTGPCIQTTPEARSWIPPRAGVILPMCQMVSMRRIQHPQAILLRLEEAQIPMSFRSRVPTSLRASSSNFPHDSGPVDSAGQLS